MTADLLVASRVDSVATGRVLASMGVHNPKEAFWFRRSLKF
jgi:hypothetical protein